MANKTTFGDKVRNFVDKLNPRYADVITSTPVELNKYAYMTTWYYSPKLGQPRFGTPLPTMRKFAQTPQVAMCIKTIIDEITGIEWDIVPRDEYKDTYNKEKAEEVKQFFMYPNRNGETTDDITKMLAKDIFEIDAGVLVKTFDTESYGKPKKYTYNQKQYNENCEYTEDKKIQHTTKKLLPKIEEEEEEINGKTVKTITRNGKLLEIFARDGGSFLQAPDYYGILPDDKPAYFQYSFLATGARPLAFFKREIVYFKMNPRSNNPYGWSPIESLFMILESLNNAVRFNKMFFEENAIPSGALSLIGANKDAFKRFKAMWNKKLKGKPHKLALFNEDMKFTRFVMKNRDMEWLEGQKFYQRLVWAMYGVTSDELGFTETSNRSVGQSQSRVFVRRAIRPLLQLLEQKFTNEVISEFYDDEPEVEFRYHFIDIHEEHLKREEEWEDVNSNIRTVNEIRLDRGLEPVEWGDDKPNDKSQAFSFGFGQQPDNPKPKSEDKKSLKKKTLDPREAPEVKDAAGYSSFLQKYWGLLEKEVIQVFNEEQTGIIHGKQIVTRKAFGEFLRRITHLFTVAGLKEQVAKYMGQDWNQGLKEAEDTLNLDIGVRESDREVINHYAEQQVDGYVLPDGKRWTGITGINNQLQIRVGEAVVDGIKEGKGPDAIAKDIKGVFDTTTSRAKTIARTEGARIKNTAHLKGYMNSDVVKGKEWVATMDGTTSKECKELNGQVVPLQGAFELKNGEKYIIPPQHPNCRCRIAPVLE